MVQEPSCCPAAFCGDEEPIASAISAISVESKLWLLETPALPMILTSESCQRNKAWTRSYRCANRSHVKYQATAAGTVDLTDFVLLSLLWSFVRQRQEDKEGPCGGKPCPVHFV